jgi:hypothetical protein
MIIVSMKKNCLGTMDFTIKMGKMKKAEEFTTYPIAKDDDAAVLRLQSSHRWAEMNTKTGEVIMSARRAQYANSVWLMCCKLNHTTESDKATEEQLEQMLSAIRGTASPMAGGDNILSMYCDNSNAIRL